MAGSADGMAGVGKAGLRAGGALLLLVAAAFSVGWSEIGSLESEITSLRSTVGRLHDAIDGMQSDAAAKEGRWNDGLTDLVREQVKRDLEREVGLATQGELLVRLAQQVKRISVAAHDAALPDGEGPASRARVVGKAPPRGRSAVPPCVNNPALHYERVGQLVAECHPHQNPEDDPRHGWPAKAYVLSLAGHEADAEVRIAELRRVGIDTERFPAVNGAVEFAQSYIRVQDTIDKKQVDAYRDPQTGAVVLRGEPGFLSPGERGYIATMRALAEKVLADGNVRGNVLVLDDDVLLACDFKESLDRVLAQRRCGTMVLENSDPGGVLLLGAAIWINGTYPDRGPWTAGWQLTDADLKLAQGQLATDAARPLNSETPLCHNVHSKTFGSFAAMYHVSALREIVAWCKTATVPFDHIFPHLTKEGFIIRAAFPSVAIQDVRHASQVDSGRTNQSDMAHRAALHRWLPLSRFCEPKTGKALAEDSG